MDRRCNGLSCIRLNLAAFGLVAVAGFLTSLTQGGDGAGSSESAASMMKNAHDGRAVWEKFPGFQAKIRTSVDGSQIEGTVTVSSGGTIQLDLPTDEKFAWVEGSLRSIVGHRLSHDDAISSVEFADNQVAHPLGRLIKSTGATDKSLWRVQGDLLTEVHRFNEKTRFVISVTDVVRNAEGKHLPRNFNVTTWDVATGQIKSSRQVFNEWQRVGSVDLPVKLFAAISKDDGSRRVEQIEFFEHQLTATTAAANRELSLDR